MQPFREPLIKENGIFTGSDIVAGIYVPALGKYQIFGELATISYSSYRVLSPARVLGRVGPKGFGRGPRTLGGSLVFSVFDRHVLYGIQAELKEEFEKQLAKYRGDDKAASSLHIKFLTDEIPPFDVVVSMANEYNNVTSSLVISGIRIVTEGQIMSMEDMFIENQMQYVAEGIGMMVPEQPGKS